MIKLWQASQSGANRAQQQWLKDVSTLWTLVVQEGLKNAVPLVEKMHEEFEYNK